MPQRQPPGLPVRAGGHGQAEWQRLERVALGQAGLAPEPEALGRPFDDLAEALANRYPGDRHALLSSSRASVMGVRSSRTSTGVFWMSVDTGCATAGRVDGKKSGGPKTSAGTALAVNR